jgi:endonuclease/exonuclease/phosphatase (EEP) superfamily protein YafD
MKYLRSGGTWLGWLANGGLVGLLCFSLLAPWSLLADSFSHLRLYLLAGLAVMAGLSAAMRCRRTVVVLLLALGLGICSLWPLWRSTEAEGPNPRADLTLLQLNVLYNNPTPELILAYVRRHQPDVIALQEVSDQTIATVDQLQRDYPYLAYCPNHHRVRDDMVLSRIAPVSSESLGCKASPDGHSAVPYLTLRVAGRPFTVVSVHLSWPYPGPQQAHIDALAQIFPALPGPLILAGDFNAAPWSHAMQRIQQASDTHLIGGIRHSWFHKRRPHPGLPLDHVLLPDRLHAQTIEVGEFVGSDHRPVLVKIGSMQTPD